MRKVLETCERPYDAQCAVVCMDEQLVQLVKDTRESLPATENHPRRVHGECGRGGGVHVLQAAEQLVAGDRKRRKKTYWAHEVAGLLDGRYSGCGNVTLVLDNLNTHPNGAYDAAFEPERARKLVRRIESCYTPKHSR